MESFSRLEDRPSDTAMQARYFDRIFETSPYSMIAYAPDGRATRANSAWEHLFATSRSELIGYNLLEDRNVTPEEMRKIKEVFTGARAATLEPRYYDPAGNDRNGRPRWIQARFYPLKNDDGSLREVMAIIEDVTYQKEAVQRLESTEDTFRQIAQFIPMIVFTAGPDGTPDYYNQRWFEATGLPQVQLEPNLWKIAIHPDDFEEVDKSWRAALREGRAWEHQYRILGRDGQYRWHLGRSVPQCDVGGKIVRWYGAATDIDEQKRAEIELKISEGRLRESEARFQNMADTAPVMIWVTDKDRRFTYFNKPWLDFTGRPRQKELTLGWADLFHPDDRRHGLATFEEAFSRREPCELEFRLLRHDAEFRWVLSRATPRFAPDGAFLGYIGSCIDITDRKLAGDAIARVKDQLQTVTDAAPVLIAYIDRGRRYQFVNAAYTKYFARPKADFLGIHVWDLLGPDYEKLKDSMSEALEGHPKSFERTLMTALGPRRLSVRYAPDRRGDGEIHGLVVVGVDVTELSQVELKLRQSKDQLEAILRGVTDGINVIDRDGRIIYANQAGARIWGLASVEDLIGKSSQDFLRHFEVFDEKGRHFDWSQGSPGARVLRGETNPAEVTIALRKPNHPTFEAWYIVTSSAVLDDDGSPVFAIKIFHDFTERRRDEELHKFIAEAASILNSSLDSTTTLQNLTRLAVPKIADWCTVTMAEDDGRLEQIAVAHTDPRRIEMIRGIRARQAASLDDPFGPGSVIRTGKTEYYPFITPDIIDRTCADDAVRAMAHSFGFVSYICVPLRVQGRVVGAISFITAESARHLTENDRRLAEELAQRASLAVENARLYAEAQAVNRIKDEFLATLSHELRTPLNVIQGHAELLMTETGLPPSVVESIEAIHRNARVQTQIVNDLLDISAIVSGKVTFHPRPLDPVPSVRAAIEAVRFTANVKNITVTEDLPVDGVKVFADPTRLQQIAWNLLSNAVKFTPNGGAVTVRARSRDRRFELIVADSGVGIERDFLPYVFDRFRQEDSAPTRRFGGLGLGLAIVRHLVEIHGGQVQVASEGKDKGSVFTVWLPLADGERNPIEERGPAPEETVQPLIEAAQRLPEGLRVLIVEDEDDARALLLRMIERAGAHAIAVATVGDALAEVERLRPNVIVSDIGIPDEDGYSLIRKIRARENETGEFTPAIALTAYAREAERRRSLSAGFQAHLSKPVSASDLITAIQKTLAL